MIQAFTQRHIGTDVDAQSHMLATLGYDSVQDLVSAAMPASIHADLFRQDGDSALPPAASENEAIAELRALAGRNTVKRSMIGLGYYDTFTPAVIKRNVFENPSWYTAYTPYQPEISQGRLEALINFQTMIADLTGLTTANASMLDESTAVVEGMLLALRASKSKSRRFIVDTDAFPQTHALLANRAAALGIELAQVALNESTTADDLGDYFGVFVQYPAASGRIWNPQAVIDLAHEHKALAVVAADLLALTLVKSPGDLGADVAVGTSQRFGVPMGFGGPHAGYMAVRTGLERQLPGRLVGVSVDATGHPAYRLALQVREQHIRRDKATSNICTAQVLLAVMAGMYAVYHGPQGLKAIAEQVHERAGALVLALRAIDVDVINDTFFDTIRVSVPTNAADIVAKAAASGYNLHQVDPTTISISVDETTTLVDLSYVVGAFGGRSAFGHVDFGASQYGVPADLGRESEFLTHPVFNTHRSETSMMRYLKRLADYDYALDRGMIPLGSCTMKLNAASEMEAVSWPEFAGIHPFAPRADVEGYLHLVRQLETWMSDVTGYDSVSLQPNAGSQGELAGLLAIRGYHQSNGDTDRTVCLIPSSAHGTNAASAALAGMRVVVVACDELGNVDLDDLHAKIAEHAENLAALMITYPSTHGVYEHEVATICAAVHAAGGQVYVDGANLNALLGFARYGDFGGDVSHLNLHKTFCIPHGGGGPGVGPVAAKAHLASFLPGHPLAQSDEHYLIGSEGTTATVVHAGGPVSGAPYGSPSILPISWAYVRMMGIDGLKQATGAAVLAANYVAKRLENSYPLLYSGENGLVAHECILDLRPLTAATGISVDDVAKRLVDYGFHSPTMSFPVAGTLMVEPTESEDLGEIDRFVDAMIAIKAEADAVAAGRWPADDNPLHNAPHTAQSVIEGEWEHPYDRSIAVYPLANLVRNKYWPPVRRIDNAYGDRNLVCACPSPEAFEEPVGRASTSLVEPQHRLSSLSIVG
ncbi:MAG: aminomethyl-transferring glycine dehydrogenase [Cryobacterium sp.]|uniref:aminomethyl-transferring glycine dehydrogenase n=1 Tax=unclassified Cryobacterium TaxID=2649013 RepID=UPI0018CA58D1|nr:MULTISPECIES: aminomethyl-transferring glycine dehydrogenase [unclassified Cryobacterium]MCY7405296.1 aminomethyl-transferring glycine dehydrogenase [Cryobacterium sp.]MEC5153011.1 glycine dehydrogenase [Cryobacterium sp. CAN_C3]